MYDKSVQLQDLEISPTRIFLVTEVVSKVVGKVSGNWEVLHEILLL
jgi:hypothetical protein